MITRVYLFCFQIIFFYKKRILTKKLLNKLNYVCRTTTKCDEATCILWSLYVWLENGLFESEIEGVHSFRTIFCVFIFDIALIEIM